MNVFFGGFLLIVVATVSSANSDCEPVPLHEACPEIPPILQEYYFGDESPMCIKDHMVKNGYPQDEWTWETMKDIIPKMIEDTRNLKNNEEMMNCVMENRDEQMENFIEAIENGLKDPCKSFIAKVISYLKGSFGCIFEDWKYEGNLKELLKHIGDAIVEG